MHLKIVLYRSFVITLYFFVFTFKLFLLKKFYTQILWRIQIFQLADFFIFIYFFFSLALDEDGVAYVMGRSEYGRLGLGEGSDDATTPTPLPVNFSETESKIIQVSAGECVSYVLTESGMFLRVIFLLINLCSSGLKLWFFGGLIILWLGSNPLDGVNSTNIKFLYIAVNFITHIMYLFLLQEECAYVF